MRWSRYTILKDVFDERVKYTTVCMKYTVLLVMHLFVAQTFDVVIVRLKFYM